jgi:hypothetical protein
MISDEGLIEFVRESNAIEGILRDPTSAEVLAHLSVLKAKRITLHVLRAFVQIVADAPLREQMGQDVVVGNHRPPVGGPHIKDELEKILQAVNQKGANIYKVHAKYETLHPFMDGNGRSGRVLWLWMMQRKGYTGPEHGGRYLNFLHVWYYQSLANFPERA